MGPATKSAILRGLTSQGITKRSDIKPENLKLVAGDKVLEIPRTHAVVFGWTDNESRDRLVADLRQVIGEEYDCFGIVDQTDADRMEIVGFDHGGVRMVAVLLKSAGQILAPWRKCSGRGYDRAEFRDVFDPEDEGDPDKENRDPLS